MKSTTGIWERLFGDWSVHLEKRVPPPELLRSLEEASIPSGGFYLMLALSSGIATLGLISNSAAVIIGAMIIAPLMNPIVSLSYGSVRGNGVLIMRSLLTLLSGVLLVLVVSVGVTMIVGSRVVGDEVLSRTNPNLLDLGIAIGAGAAGAFALTRSRIGNAIPGVAVAVALVPPLCVCGIGLAFGTHAVIDPAIGLSEADAAISLGAFLLFLTNLAAILLLAGTVFVAQGYGRWQLASRQIVLVVITLVVLIVPLNDSFQAIYLRGRILTQLRAIAQERDDWHDVHLLDIEIFLHTEPASVRLDIYAPVGIFGEEDLRYVKHELAKRIKYPIHFIAYVVEFRRVETESMQTETETDQQK